MSLVRRMSGVLPEGTPQLFPQMGEPSSGIFFMPKTNRMLQQGLQLDNLSTSLSLDVCAQAPNEFPLTEPLFDFNALLASKIFVNEDIVSPLIDSERDLQLALYSDNHMPLASIQPTSSVSDMTVTESNAVPEAIHTAGTFTPSTPELNSSHASSLSPQDDSHSRSYYSVSQVEQNLIPTPYVQENGVTNAFAYMPNTQHNLHGFLSRAVPLTQLVSAAAEINAHVESQPLLTAPCALSKQPTSNAEGYGPSCSKHIPLYSSAPPFTFRPALPLIEPIIKKTSEQAGTTTVSLAMSRGSPTAVAGTFLSERRFATTLSDMNVLTPKRHAAPRLYECPTCHKLFDRAYNRKMHMTTHEAIEKRLRPFACPLETCDKKFARKHDRNRHYLGVHLRSRKGLGTAKKLEANDNLVKEPACANAMVTDSNMARQVAPASH